MQKLLLIFLICIASCKNKPAQQPMQFDKVKWLATEGKTYPYRDLMLADFISSYPLHGMKGDSIISLLGEPNRIDNGHLFYTVYQKYFPNTTWPISTKTLVIKLGKDSTVEWRKIHE